MSGEVGRKCSGELLPLIVVVALWETILSLHSSSSSSGVVVCGEPILSLHSSSSSSGVVVCGGVGGQGELVYQVLW